MNDEVTTKEDPMHPFRSHLFCVALAALLSAAAGAAEPQAPGGGVLCVVAQASGGEHASHHRDGQGSGAAGAEEQAPRSGGPAAPWADLRGMRDAIAADVDAGRLGEVHAKAERLAPLGHGLLAASVDLAPEKRARVESAVKQLPKLADALHDAADAGNADATRREAKRLDGLLALIRAQYPPEALSAPAPAANGPGSSMHPHAPAASLVPGHEHAERPFAAVGKPAVADVVVRVNEFSFEPRRVELRAGVPTRIELENQGALEHALIVRAPSGAGDWIHLHAPAKGADAGTFELDRPGVYALQCTIQGHAEAGMVGELVVVRER